MKKSVINYLKGFDFFSLRHRIYLKLLYSLYFFIYFFVKEHYLEPVGKNLERNLLYVRFKSEFRKSPVWLRNHRYYFRSENRGFGEDAFHVGWLFLFNHFRISRALEIGVYRGQTISLWALIGKELNLKLQVYGISPLSNSGDSVSKYLTLNYEKDILGHFKKFDLPSPILVRDFSTSKSAKKLIENGNWDLVYIDGSHEYEDVLSDFESSLKGLRSGGILVMDDSSLYTNFRLSFPGHPGPSEVLRENNCPNLRHIFSIGHNNFFQKID